MASKPSQPRHPAASGRRTLPRLEVSRANVATTHSGLGRRRPGGSFRRGPFARREDRETSPSRIPREAIARVQVGHSSRGNAILRGAVIGAAVGVSFALAVDPALVIGHPSEVAQSVGVPGAMLGALIGAIRSGERWRTVDQRAVHPTVPSNGAGGLQLGLAPQRRGMGVSLSVRF